MKKKQKLKTILMVAMTLTLVLLGLGKALADDTGWKNPSNNALVNKEGFENNPEGAYDDGVSEASSVCQGVPESHDYWDYNLGVPAGALINGIEVRLDWWLDKSATSAMNVELSWDGGNSWTTAKMDSNPSTTERTAILGGPLDNWGHTWTANELNDNLRVRVTHSTTGG